MAGKGRHRRTNPLHPTCFQPSLPDQHIEISNYFAFWGPKREPIYDTSIVSGLE